MHKTATMNNGYNKYNILVLCSHKRHSTEDTLYPLLHKMLDHPMCGRIDICSRAYEPNHPFFYEESTNKIYVCQITKDISQLDCETYAKNCQQVELSPEVYDVIVVRLGKRKNKPNEDPTNPSFWNYLTKIFPETHIINRPQGIMETGSKEFLLQVKNLIPDSTLVRSVRDVLEFHEKHKDSGIVLKPLNSCGGKGMLRVHDGKIWVMKDCLSFSEYSSTLDETLKQHPHLAMKFLKNVTQGDKRVIVVNGEIVGTSLRKPQGDSWICNASMGGTSHSSPADDEELKMAKELTPILMKRGIVMFGFDTLVDDNQKRVLSEINSACCGGLVQAQRVSGAPVLERAALGLWSYITANITCKVRTSS